MESSNFAKRTVIFSGIVLTLLISACTPGFLTQAKPTPTPTKTPRPQPVTFATQTPAPTFTATTIPTETPVPPTETPAPTETPIPTDTATPIPTETPVPPTNTPAPPAATSTPVPPTATPAPTVDFVISSIHVMGLGENNGGIEGGGATHIIFITVVDAAGNPIDGAHIVNVAPYPGETVSGDKGPGKAEITMWEEVFNLTIDSVNGAPVTSEVSHNLSLVNPVAEDIVGKLGGADYSNPTCVTLADCPIPIPKYKSKHFSYQLTFQRTY